ncbi:MAG: MATE family efflux transporter, partial [Planctomycetota bacterium]
MDGREEVASQVSETLPAPAISARLGSQAVSSSYRGILLLAGPLILSTTGFMLMHLLDFIFLARYSSAAVAAAGAAGMAGFTLVGFFSSISGYVCTFVAQYMGARRPERVGAAVWQSLYLAAASAVIVAALGFLAEPLFRLVRHESGVQAIEVRYLQIICWTALLPLLSTALSGFYVGRGDNTTVLVVQLFGLAANGFLSYGFIFGRFGLPEWGAPGAACAMAPASPS